MIITSVDLENRITGIAKLLEYNGIFKLECTNKSEHSINWQYTWYDAIDRRTSTRHYCKLSPIAVITNISRRIDIWVKVLSGKYKNSIGRVTGPYLYLGWDAANCIIKINLPANKNIKLLIGYDGTYVYKFAASHHKSVTDSHNNTVQSGDIIMWGSDYNDVCYGMFQYKDARTSRIAIKRIHNKKVVIEHLNKKTPFVSMFAKSEETIKSEILLAILSG